MDSHHRVTVKLKAPNPLFKKWLKEWIDDAEKKRKRSSQVYQKALDSLNKYPLNFYSGADCAILENFGPKICQMLDDRLEKHLQGRLDLFQHQFFKDKVTELQNRETDRYMELVRMIENGISISDNNEDDVFDTPGKDQENVNNLFTNNDEAIDLETVNRVNQSHGPQENFDDDIQKMLSSPEPSDSEDSFDRMINKGVLNKPKKTAIKTNPANDLLFSSSPIASTSNVSKLRRSKTFDHGKLNQFTTPTFTSSPISNFLDVEVLNQSPVARPGNIVPVVEPSEDEEFKRLMLKYGFPEPTTSKAPTIKTKNSKTKLPKSSSENFLGRKRPIPSSSNNGIHERDEVRVQKKNEDEENDFDYVSIDEINPSDYDVILAVDLQETSGKTSASDDKLIQTLNEGNVKTDVRKLHIGDFLWIAKHKTETKEFVLPYVIERKRLDDLSKSIKDGRYHEQKFRLQKCGVENIIYVIENMKSSERGFGLPLTTLMQAATNTQIHSKFQVKFTDSFNHTIIYLTVMTSFIENIFKNKAPVKFKLIDFTKFNKSSMKQRRLTVREAFMRQLMVLKGLSFDVAVEITKHYPTPYSLYRKYQTLNEREGENLLSELTVGEMKRKISKPISQTIYALYTTKSIN